MKKVFFALCAGMIVLAACDKDDDGPASIQGTWTANQIVATSYINGDLSDSDTSTTGTVTFNSDGTTTSVDDNGTTTGTYSYDESSKLLTVVSDGDTSAVTVTNLTSNNLHLVADESSEISGFIIRVTVDADYRR